LRRLAAQSRGDTYSSLRDYQTVHEARGRRIRVRRADGDATVVLKQLLGSVTNTPFVGFGGFLRPRRDTKVTIELRTDGAVETKDFPLHDDWTRVALVLKAPEANDAKVTLTWPASIALDIWGLACDRIDLPEQALERKPNTDTLAKGHFAPETFYLPHEGPLTLDVDPSASSPVTFSEGAPISLKKCAYCGRHLPLDMDRLGALSFHKHRAKRTNHQNECRSCKAWRINNHFNPIRTVDQLHESSSITRERKLLLREPEILQAIKERDGRGLKSIIWERFDRRCFACGKPLRLNEVHLDHTRPLAYLWPIDEHATCLCADHNNEKKEKFPVDFYNDAQLRRLSKVTGLSYEQLTEKRLNDVELQRILDNLPAFALDWEPRTFAATARKIAELRPDIDLYERLRNEEAATYADLVSRLAERPPPIEE
jgi:hypothetical protein